MTCDLQTMQALIWASTLIMKIIHKTQTQMESHFYLLHIKAVESESTIRTEIYSKSNPQKKTIHLYLLATHSSVLAWRILWMEEPGGLLSTGSHRFEHDWSNLACMHACLLQGQRKLITFMWWLSDFIFAQQGLCWLK